jgi:GNAT superfamily N-acetyltransferase
LAALTVRPAAAGDAERVAELLTELGRTPLSEATRPAFRSTYLAHIARPDTADLVAEVDGAVVGFCSLEFHLRLNRLRPEAWIPDLIVTEGMRGRGIGRALLQRAFDLARERDCRAVVLDSGLQREAAHRLYRSAGMRDSALHFTLPLHPDAG